MLKCCTIKVKSFHKKYLKKLLTNLFINLKLSFNLKVIYLPTKKRLFNVLKSSFVHAKAKEQFFLKTYQIQIFVFDTNTKKLLTFFKASSLKNLGIKIFLKRNIV